MDSSTSPKNTIRLRIEGMTCGSCVARVERALRGVDGVEHARVNLATGMALIEWAGSNDIRQQLIEAVRQSGYDADTARPGDRSTATDEITHVARLREHRQAVWQSLATAVPIMALHWSAPWLQSGHAAGYVWPQAMQAILLAMMLGSAAGAPILAGGLRALLHRSANMDLLVSMGVSVAFVAGVTELITAAPHSDHLHAASMILLLVNVGRYIELRARRQALSAVSALARFMPATAQLVTEDGVHEVPIERIRLGDRVRMAQDTVVAVDGVIREGRAAIDESAVTGESMPRDKGTGDEVFAGAIVRDGLITVTATRIGSESAIGRILRAVEEAQSGKTDMQRIADRVAGVFVPIVLALALLTGIGVGFSATWDWGEGIRRAVAVLVIACPCAMGLATPIAVIVATGAAAKLGILVRDAAALESAGRIDCLLLDKTGTLTAGQPCVVDVVPPGGRGRAVSDGFVEKDVLQLAASAEQFAQHPLARAIVQEARSRNIPLLGPTAFVNEAGRGVRTELNQDVVRVGSLAYLSDSGVDLAEIRGVAEQLSENGRTVVAVGRNDRCVGLIALMDDIRPHAVQAVQEIRNLGVQIAMLTGDQEVTARAVGHRLAIPEVLAGLSPSDKLAEVQRRRKQGRRIGFVGDGINDAPALTAADVGITFASATDAAVGAAAITIVHDDLRRLPTVITLARRSVRIIRQNLFWAFFYNIVAIPLAALGCVPPAYAAGAMMISSITVVLNSLRLRRLDVHMAGLR